MSERDLRKGDRQKLQRAGRARKKNTEEGSGGTESRGPPTPDENPPPPKKKKKKKKSKHAHTKTKRKKAKTARRKEWMHTKEWDWRGGKFHTHSV